jgi:regulator of sigma E protease
MGDWEPLPPGEAIAMGAKYPYVQTGIQLAALWKMITGKREGRVGGPVAIVTQMAGSTRAGVASFMLFAALISALLGMFNLLPIPALDGGRLLFMLFEVIFRRPVPKAIEERVHMVGLIGLFGLIIYATVGDVGNLVSSDHDWRREVSDVKAKVIEADNAAESGEGEPPQAP